MAEKMIEAEEVKKHNKDEDLWLIIDRKVYNLTSYYPEHPGGTAMLRNARGDASRGFHSVPAHKHVQTFIKQTLRRNLVGIVSTAEDKEH